MGLESYYRMQAATETYPGASVIDDGSSASSVDKSLDLLVADTIEPMADGHCRVRLAVNGLHCAACSWLIEKTQPYLAGVKHAEVRMSDHSIQLIYDPRKTSPLRIARNLARLGYHLSPWLALDDREQTAIVRRQHLKGIAVAFFFAANAMWIGVALYAGEATGMLPAHANFFRAVGTGLGVLAAIIPGRVFFRTAFQALRTRTPHVDIPVALAIGVGTVGSVFGTVSGTGHIYFDSIASLILLLLVGRYLQFRAQHQAGLSLERLFQGNMALAHRLEADGTTRQVRAERLVVGDRILVKHGETLPADGVVQQGRSHLNCAWLTGESRPVAVGPGDRVTGGTVNLEGDLEVAVEALGETSRLGKLNRLIQHAAAQKTPLIRLADRVGEWFVWVVLLLSLVTFIFWAIRSDYFQAMQHTISLLTIACPCALALAAPLVITVAIGRAARASIWIRDGEVFERLAKPGIAWLDKTGTLTTGEMRVQRWTGDPTALAWAAMLEEASTHPIAAAIRCYATESGAVADDSRREYRSKVTGVEVLPGRGIRGRIDQRWVGLGAGEWMRQAGIEVRAVDLAAYEEQARHGATPVMMAVDGATVGVFGIGDSLRPVARQVFQALKQRGWKVGILSGDHLEVVADTAARLEGEGSLADRCFGQLSPEAKLERIAASKNHVGLPVMMVGDGINDAAALAMADVGVAIRSGDDTSLCSSQVYIPGDRLEAVVELVDASPRCLRAIYRCFAASLIYNAVTISLAMSGWMHPLLAAILMPISGITVLTMAMTASNFALPENATSGLQPRIDRR
jgi:Cu2+-exporting ATPase